MDSVEQLKKTCDELAGAWDEFKKENNKVIGKAVKDVLAEAQLDNIQQKLDDLTGTRDALIKRIDEERKQREDLERKYNDLKVSGGVSEKDDKLQKRLRKGLTAHNLELKSHAIRHQKAVPQEASMEDYLAYRAAFANYMRKDSRMLSPQDVKTLDVGVDPEGGYLVPADYTGQLVQILFDNSPIRQIASVQNISSDRLDGIEDVGETAAGWVSETGARTSNTNTPAVGKWEIVAQELYCAPQATQRLLDDAMIDVEAWLAMKVADKLARVEGTAFCVGTGVMQPRGIFSYPTAATGDNTRAWGTFEHVGTGASGAFAADPNGGDKLFDLVAAFRPPYLNNARWLTRRSVIAAIRKMKATTGNYLWQPGLQAGQPDTIIAFPIILAEDVPALGANSLSMAFGDFRQGYQIVDRLGVRTLRDPFTNKPYVIFYTTKRTGGGALNYQAIKFIKFI